MELTNRIKPDQHLKELLGGAPRAEPHFIEPMKCKLVEALPKHGHWFYELKYDGYRALAIKNGRQLTLLSRNRKDLSARFPELARSLSRLACQKVTLDGEIVALANDRPSFQTLQNAGQPGTDPSSIYYYAFDLLNLDGRDLTALPLEVRRNLLTQLLKRAPNGVCVSRSVEGAADVFLKEVTRRGLEGLIAKKAGSPYEAGKRSGAWIKYKFLHEQEFVIGGYTLPQGSRQAFGAILVGFYENGRLRYASKVGTGYSMDMLRRLFEKFEPLRQPKTPFCNVPEPRHGRWGQGLTASDMKRCVWLKPRLVCQVAFSEWTEGAHLRQPVFKGLRDDKDPIEVVQEIPS